MDHLDNKLPDPTVYTPLNRRLQVGVFPAIICYVCVIDYDPYSSPLEDEPSLMTLKISLYAKML